MELKETINNTQSEDWKERLKEEYWQLSERIRKLEDVINNWDEFEERCHPNYDRYLMSTQYKAMCEYANCLEDRADADGIEL